jgi:hypothetical protein
MRHVACSGRRLSTVTARHATLPPCSKDIGGVSVHPPLKSIRDGALATTVVSGATGLAYAKIWPCESLPRTHRPTMIDAALSKKAQQSRRSFRLKERVYGPILPSLILRNSDFEQLQNGPARDANTAFSSLFKEVSKQISVEFGLLRESLMSDSSNVMVIKHRPTMSKQASSAHLHMTRSNSCNTLLTSENSQR